MRSGSLAGAGGAAIGLLGGGVGLILGSLRLPLMIRLLKINPRRAAGSNLVVGAALGIFGFVGHGIHGEIDLPLLLAMASTGMLGSYVGARYTGRVSVRSLVVVLAWVLLAVGIILSGTRREGLAGLDHCISEDFYEVAGVVGWRRVRFAVGRRCP